MQNKILIGLCASLGMLLGGCGTKADDPAGTASSPTTNDTNDEDSDTEDSDTNDEDTDDPSDTNDEDSDPSDSQSTDPTADTSDTDPSDTDGDTDSGPDTVGFIQDPDGGGVSIECDLWGQDCPEGEKCMPWANDGGGAWNAARCSPLDPNPAQVGDECTVEGSGVSGIDNCDIASMCWDVDPETNLGTCVSFCMGSEANPICEDPATNCVIANEGTLILCLPNCDPLLQDCAEGNACYPIVDAFACAPDVSGETGVYGDVCEFINVCDPGLLCANPEFTPDCAGASCCTPFCDMANPNASAECPGNAGGQECVAWYEEGQAPPGFEDVGFCAIPA
jgi:hypothetical protein